MLIISNILENIANASESIRRIKARTFGSNVETAENIMEPGSDYKVPENMQAIFAKTSNSSETVIIGYYNDHILEDLADGEKGHFSFDTSGPQAFIKYRVNGNLELNGNDDFAVRYTILKEEYDKTKDVLDSIVQILTGSPITEPGNGAPSALQTALSAALTGKITGDISASKVENVNLPS